PSCARISSRVPEQGASMSAAVFSVSIEYKGSPALNVSPGLFNQPVMVASVMFMLTRGNFRTTFKALSSAGENGADRRDNRVLVGDHGFLQHGGVGNGYVGHRHAADRGPQGIESSFGRHRRDMAGGAATVARLIDDDQTTG